MCFIDDKIIIITIIIIIVPTPNHHDMKTYGGVENCIKIAKLNSDI